MTDTTEEMALLHQQMLMRRDGATRFLMGCDMFTTARTLMKANLQQQTQDETELRVLMFLRTYQEDFSAEQLSRIVERLRQRSVVPPTATVATTLLVLVSITLTFSLQSLVI